MAGSQKESARVEIVRADTPAGPRLRVRDNESGATIYLDPIELEGLTRLRYNADELLRTLVEDADGAAPDAPADLETMQNEFAMVQIGRVHAEESIRLYIRDLASKAETMLTQSELVGLTSLHHRELAPLLDPSELAAASEPDPDQV
jgi:hypothetical protein